MQSIFSQGVNFPTVAGGDGGGNGFEDAVLSATNEYRKNHGEKFLVLSKDQSNSAYEWADFRPYSSWQSAARAENIADSRMTGLLTDCSDAGLPMAAGMVLLLLLCMAREDKQYFVQLL